MSRQLFLHHYLPSHLASALLAGSVFSFILSDSINYPISVAGRMTRMQPTQYADLGVKGPTLAGIFAVLMIAVFLHMSPLTYGSPGYVIRTLCFICVLTVCVVSTVRA